MEEYVKTHEEYIRDNMDAENSELEKLLEYHLRQIEWVQHERFVHLFIMLFIIVLFLVSFAVFYIIGTWPFFILMAIFFLLTVFYIKHYYFLENRIQEWYSIANEINYRLKGIGQF